MTPRSHFSGISFEKVKRQMERERKWALGEGGENGSDDSLHSGHFQLQARQRVKEENSHDVDIVAESCLLFGIITVIHSYAFKYLIFDFLSITWCWSLCFHAQWC